MSMIFKKRKFSLPMTFQTWLHLTDRNVQEPSSGWFQLQNLESHYLPNRRCRGQAGPGPCSFSHSPRPSELPAHRSCGGFAPGLVPCMLIGWLPGGALCLPVQFLRQTSFSFLEVLAGFSPLLHGPSRFRQAHV